MPGGTRPGPAAIPCFSMGSGPSGPIVPPPNCNARAKQSDSQSSFYRPAIRLAPRCGHKGAWDRARHTVHTSAPAGPIHPAGVCMDWCCGMSAGPGPCEIAPVCGHSPSGEQRPHRAVIMDRARSANALIQKGQDLRSARCATARHGPTQDALTLAYRWNRRAGKDVLCPRVRRPAQGSSIPRSANGPTTKGPGRVGAPRASPDRRH